jgi:hypothetical protein
MRRGLSGLLLISVTAACGPSTREIRESGPELEGVFSGAERMLASCVAEDLVGGPAIVPVLRDAPGPSTISATRGYMGDQILVWELRFTQVDVGHSRVQLRARKTPYDRYSTESDMWKAVGACSRRGK